MMMNLSGWIAISFIIGVFAGIFLVIKAQDIDLQVGNFMKDLYEINSIKNKDTKNV
jgi:uncharacterized protein YneF (UPF0154 family)